MAISKEHEDLQIMLNGEQLKQVSEFVFYYAVMQKLQCAEYNRMSVVELNVQENGLDVFFPLFCTLGYFSGTTRG